MSGKEITPAFEPDELGFQLAATPIPRLHETFGEGVRYALGPDPETPVADVEVYPAAKLIRYSSGGIQITLTGETLSGRYEPDEVIFEARSETANRMLRITRFGDSLAMNSILPPIEGRLVHAEPDDMAPAEPHGLSPKTEQEKQERVALLGRAGRDARLQQTAKGVDIARFPLAVHDEVEGAKTTTWRTVVAFNALAREVAETVKKGNEYKVIGYKHERIDKDKTIEEIYAAVVKPPTPKTPASRDAQGKS